MERSVGFCATDRAGRYLGQLCAHLGRKADATWTEDAGTITFGWGVCTLRAADDGLHLEVEAEDVAGHDRARAVVEDHLVRFGARDELAISWGAVI